jgi:murein DD-endopeptidase MepM/ murein hydrolase activator NlpD
LFNKTSTGRLPASLLTACSLFSHLRKGSIAVKEGDRVEAGGFIAAVDNSGNSIQPYLH